MSPKSHEDCTLFILYNIKSCGGSNSLHMLIWGLHLLKLQALIEVWLPFGTFWDEVETDASNVLLGLEILRVVNLVAFDFQFQ